MRNLKELKVEETNRRLLKNKFRNLNQVYLKDLFNCFLKKLFKRYLFHVWIVSLLVVISFAKKINKKGGKVIK
jgi:hypothetical protein